MDDHVARIDENPIALGQSLDPEIAVTLGFELLDQLIGDGADMPGGAAGRNHHAVGDRGFAVEVDRDDVLGLGVFELSENGLEDGAFGLALRRRSGLRRALSGRSAAMC